MSVERRGDVLPTTHLGKIQYNSYLISPKLTHLGIRVITAACREVGIGPEFPCHRDSGQNPMWMDNFRAGRRTGGF